MPLQDQPTAGALFERSAEAAFVLDELGCYQWVTAPFAQLLGQPAGQLVGTSFVASLDPLEAAQHAHWLGRAAAGEVVRYQAWLPQPTGALVMELCLWPPLGHQQVYGLVQPLAHQLSATLLERERQLTIVLNSLTDITFVLRVEAPGRYQFVFVNEAFTRTTGLPADQVIGRYVEEIIPEPSLSLVLGYYQQAVASHTRVVWQETSVYPNGTVTGEVSVTPVCDGAGHCYQLVGVVHDLTQEKRVEEELRRSNERFRYALRATSDAIYDWNLADNTLYWGEGWAELFGYPLVPQPAPLGQWAAAVHPDDQARVVHGRRQAVASGATSAWQAEYRLRRADGTWASVLDRGYLLRNPQGQVVRMLGALQDTTARQQAAAHQQRLTQQVSQQNADLQQFAYVVSHNLRAPLANALGFVALLPSLDHQAPVFEQSLQHLDTSLRQLDTLLSEVSEILSLRAEHDGFRPEPVAVAAVCQQARYGLQGPLDACGGQLVSTIGPELRLVGSRAHLHSIFHHLFANAIKYRSDARALRIEVTGVQDSQGTITLTVRDNGQGFDQQRAGADIFQLYRRFHTSPDGRGVGLFLVKAHTEAMGGQLRVQSMVDIGTQFTLSFSFSNVEDLFN
jgi:PAS domain S-box-containing protein